RSVHAAHPAPVESALADPGLGREEPPRRGRAQRKIRTGAPRPHRKALRQRRNAALGAEGREGRRRRYARRRRRSGANPARLERQVRQRAEAPRALRAARAHAADRGAAVVAVDRRGGAAAMKFLAALLLATTALAQEAAMPASEEFTKAVFFGKKFAEMKDYASAVQQFAKADALQPDQPQVLYNLALLLAKAGRFSESQAKVDRYN